MRDNLLYCSALILIIDAILMTGFIEIYHFLVLFCYRKGEEHGSAKWGNASQLSKKYADKNRYENIILTQNTRIGLDGRKHRRNLNVLVCGGSGAGKTRFYAKPNIMQANTSFVVLDPNGKEVLGYILQAVH